MSSILNVSRHSLNLSAHGLNLSRHNSGGAAATTGEKSGRPMQQEEVPAWSSYDQTAKQARSLVSRTPAVPRPTAGLRRRHSIFEALDLEAGEQLQGQDGRRRRVTSEDQDEEPQVRRSFPERRKSEWGLYFDRASMASVEFEADKDLDEAKSEPVVLSMYVKDLIRDIFSVYFEGTYESSQVSTHSGWAGAVKGTMPGSQSWIEEHLRFSSVFLFFELCLRGMGQVFFQNNPVTGLLILAGLFVQSTRVAVHGVISLLSVICSPWPWALIAISFDRDSLGTTLYSSAWLLARSTARKSTGATLLRWLLPASFLQVLAPFSSFSWGSSLSPTSRRP
jgi:hypothetical protein